MLTIERLRHILTYSPEKGTFAWNHDRRGGAKRGDVAGSVYDNGYRYIRIDHVKYLAHRLAWFYTYSDWPELQLDHIDGVKDNNRIANLREASHWENQQNRITRKRTAPQGTRFVKNGWEATITVYGAVKYLGRFKTSEEASAAYLAAKAQLHTFAPRLRK